MRLRTNALFGDYELVCTFEGCLGKKKEEQAASCGLLPGDIVPVDTSNPRYGQCPICARYRMKVTAVPAKASPPGPEGFDKIPTE